MRSIIRAIWPRPQERLALRESVLAGALVGAILLVNGLLALLILQAFAWLEDLEAGAAVLTLTPVGTGFREVWRRSRLRSVLGLAASNGLGFAVGLGPEGLGPKVPGA